MMQEKTDLVRKILAAIPQLARYAAAARINPLKGLTNHVFRIETARGDFCLRIPGPGTAAIIDRDAEERNARAAAQAGIAPKIIAFTAGGVMIAHFIEGDTLSPLRLREDAGALRRTADALRCLHDEAPAFAREFRVFAIADLYVQLLEQRGRPLRADQLALLRDAAPIRGALESRPAALKPCHCDPTGGNLIDDGEKVWLIDWEYSAMNDPMWDLAYLSIEAAFTDNMDDRLLRDYLGRAPMKPEAARFEVYKILCDLLSGLWALIQQANGNRGADFATYAENAFERCRRRLSAPSLPNIINALRNG